MQKETDLFKRIIWWAVALVISGLGLMILYYAFDPIAQWYLKQLPIRGIDVYLSASYVQFLKDYLIPRFASWKYFWYAGVPLARDYPSLYFYLMIPLTNAYGLIKGIQIFAIGGLFVLVGASFLLYYELSKNHAFSLLLAVATLYSVNLYRALIWAGGIPFWTTQAFLPIVLYCIVRFLNTENKRWVILGALVTSIGLMGHQQGFVNVIYPAALSFLFFWKGTRISFFAKEKFKIIFLYIALSVLVSLPTIHQFINISDILNTTLSALQGKQAENTVSTATTNEAARITQLQVKAWTREQFFPAFTDTHPFLWYASGGLFVIFLLLFAVRKHKLREFLHFLPPALFLGFELLYIFIFSRGISLYHGGWYKVYWPVPVAVGILAAWLWGSIGRAVNELSFWKSKAGFLVKWGGIVAVSGGLLVGGYRYMSESVNILIPRLQLLSRPTSLFPNSLGYYVKDKELASQAKKIPPSFINPDDTQYRMYEIDATVNIWWNALYKMPLTRGYVDPPLTTMQRGGIFWMDAALGPGSKTGKSSLIEDWNTPEEVVFNNTRFLFDWYATKYLEGNHQGENPALFATHVTTEEFIKRNETVVMNGALSVDYKDGVKETWEGDAEQELHYYEVKDELVSPIHMATNAVPILHLGGQAAYDTLTRFLGMLNLNSRQVVLVRGPKFIDEWPLSRLTEFKTVILYGYDYHNHTKAWKLIKQYVEKGGTVFIDTGLEVKESDSVSLPSSYSRKMPEIFPIEQTVREDLGSAWDVEVLNSPVTEGIEFDKFSPLIFDEDPWNISHAPSDGTRDEGNVILKLKSFPVIVANESGNIIWSGLNLPYHVIRDFNSAEGQLMKNILNSLVPLAAKTEPQFSYEWKSPTERTITTSGAEGVLFKEQAFPGWVITVKEGTRTKQVPYYLAGPSTPGFFYVKTNPHVSSTVTFKYQGETSVILMTIMSVVTVLFILDALVFNQKTLMRLVKMSWLKVRRPFGKWWEKDDEDN